MRIPLMYTLHSVIDILLDTLHSHIIHTLLMLLPWLSSLCCGGYTFMTPIITNAAALIASCHPPLLHPLRCEQLCKGLHYCWVQLSRLPASTIMRDRWKSLKGPRHLISHILLLGLLVDRTFLMISDIDQSRL